MEKTCRIINLFIIFLLLTSFVIIHINADETNIFQDETDQFQTESEGFEIIYNGNYIAQSFRPTFGNLTRIELLISKIGDIESNLTISIKKNLQQGNIVSKSIQSYEISSSEKWIEIIFDNVILNTEDSIYFILCNTTNGDDTNNYRWHTSLNDYYNRGTQYYTNNSGSTWFQNASRDQCFITYGKEIIKETFLSLNYIVSKTGNSIEVGIENIGNGEINNIQIDMYLDIGLLLKSKRHYDEEITTLKPGFPAKIIFSNIFVIRPITFGEVTVSVSADNIDPINQTKSVFFIPFYIYIY